MYSMTFKGNAKQIKNITRQLLMIYGKNATVKDIIIDLAKPMTNNK